MNLLAGLVAEVSRLSALHDRVLVGIDGPDAAGKTTLADKLSDALDIPTVRASIDGFHRPREQRYERGELSPDGYYTDSFDYHALLEQCLAPFLGGSARVSTASYDHRARAEAATGVTAVPTKAVLVFDGVFLLRPELRDVWTLSVYLRVSPPETLRRAHQRDLDVLGSAEQISRRYLGRYLPGQALYRRQADPEAFAQVLVDNEHAQAPVIERWVTGELLSGLDPVRVLGGVRARVEDPERLGLVPCRGGSTTSPGAGVAARAPGAVCP